MKKTFLFFALFSIMACFTSCDDSDDDNGNGNDSKLTTHELITSIDRVSYNYQSTEVEASWTYTFTYDADGKLIKCETVSIPESPTYTIDITYPTNQIVETHTIANVAAGTLTHTLNNDGNVISGVGNSGVGDDENYELTYNSDGYVNESIDHNGYSKTLTWTDGNLILSENATYTESKNKTNLDLNIILYESWVMSSAYVIEKSIPALTRKVGKSSKNLVTTDTNGGIGDWRYRYEYTFDKENYPTQIKIYSFYGTGNEDEEKLTKTYTINYDEK